jgi:hypothetical protein
LIDTALAGQSSPGVDAPILLLGGDLPGSSWGNPELARLAFGYIADHPWIQALNAQDLLAARPAAPAVPSLPAWAAAGINDQSTGQLQALLDRLQAAPDNALGSAAWQAYLAAYAPAYPTPAGLPVLRLGYLGQFGVPMEAARWADNPALVATCETDPDLDGQPECILASEDIFAVFERDFGGYLSSAFSRSPDGQAHQIIGPSFQIISGMSDASTWELTRGVLADPGVIPGAFLDPPQPGQASPPATATIQNGELTLMSAQPGGSPLAKTFRLAPGAIEVQYSGLPAGAFYSTRIPLLLDPWRRLSPGWADGYISGDLSWQLTPSLTIEVRTAANLSLSAFSDSRRYLDAPEDPNRDYPAGHYLPFPMALVDMMATGNFTATLKISYP